MQLLHEKTIPSSYNSGISIFSINYVSGSKTLQLIKLCRCLTWLPAAWQLPLLFALAQTTLHLCFGLLEEDMCEIEPLKEGTEQFPPP